MNEGPQINPTPTATPAYVAPTPVSPTAAPVSGVAIVPQKNKLLIPIIVGVVIVVAVLGFIFLGSSKVTCTNDEDFGTASMNVTVTGTFKKDSLSKMSILYSTEFENKADAETGYTTFGYQKDAWSDMEGFEVKLTKDDLTVNLEATVDVSKVSKDDRKSILTSDENTKDGFKKSFEDQGYTCK